MSRTLSILIAAIVLLGAFLFIRNMMDSHKTTVVDPTTQQMSDEPADPSLEIKQISHYENWKEFTPPNGNFKVLFPILPQHAADKILDPRTREPRKYDMYVAANAPGTVFMISAITFPNGIDERDQEDILSGIVNEMLARNTDNKLKMMEKGNFRNFRSTDFSIENGDITLGGKAFIKDNTLYVLSVIAKRGSFDVRDFDFFVNSFDLVNDQNHSDVPSKDSMDYK